MTESKASKIFNLEKDIVGEGSGVLVGRVLPAFDLFLSLFIITLLGGHADYLKEGSYPIYYPIFIGGIYLIFGIVPWTVHDLALYLKVDQIGNIVIGCILLSYIFFSKTFSNFPSLLSLYVYAAFAKSILSFVVRSLLLKKR